MKAIVRFVQREVERRLSVRADYLGALGEASFSGFLKFLLFLPAAGHRSRTSAVLIHAVKIVATKEEDCGPCVQMAVNAALDDGVAPDIVSAVLRREKHQMPEDVALVVTFAETVLSRDGSDDAPREEIRLRIGPSAVAELSLAIATARVFPTLKRGLGFARSCSLAQVRVEPQHSRRRLTR